MMRDGRLLHREGTLQVADAHFAGPPNQDVEDREPYRVPEQFEVGANFF